MNKKTVKKALLLIACAILLVVASVMGTMAYLTSKDVVTNTFTAGKVKITMDETKVDVYGVAADPSIKTQVNSYILVPGHTYRKDPIVHVAEGSEDSYLFVQIDNGIVAYEDDGKTGNADNGYKNIDAQIKANDWSPYPAVPGVYYRTYSKADGAEDYNVFENFKIEETLDNADMPTTTVNVNITAYAIQKDGFGENVNDAWNSLQAQLAHNAAQDHTVVPQPTAAQG